MRRPSGCNPPCQNIDFLRNPRDESTLVIHVAAPIRAPDGSIAGVVAVGEPTTYVNQLVSATTRRALIYGGLVGGVPLAIGWGASIWLTRPIERLTAHALALRDGRSSRLPPLAGPEVRALGRALEEMRDTLEGRNYVENYVQAVTHEIKAPLSAVRGAAELLEEDMSPDDRTRFLANIRAETDRIHRIIERLLQLAAVEKRKGLEDVVRIELAALVREVVEQLAPALAARRVKADLADEPAPGGPPVVMGEHFLLRQAILNLLHNTAEFSPAGSVIEIRLQPGERMVALAVRDHGPGVPGYALSRVFERFYSLPRPDTGAKSTGLGLSLVREIAHLHGGEVRIENHPEGGGVATMELPRAG